MTAILVTYVMPSSLFSAGGWARGWMTGVKMMMIPMRIYDPGYEDCKIIGSN